MSNIMAHTFTISPGLTRQVHLIWKCTTLSKDAESHLLSKSESIAIKDPGKLNL